MTDNVKTIRSIPLVLQGSGYPKSFEIRGEILMPWKVFEDLNRERSFARSRFCQPRNAASGTLKLQNSAVVASRKLDAYLYYLLGEDLPHDGHYENLQEAARWGFKISNSMRKVHTLQEIFDFISYWDAERKKSARGNRRNRAEGQLAPPAAQPGLHGQISPLGDSLQVSGRTCADQTGEGDLSGGAHRAVTPVANLAPVQLAGTVVKRASLHNADIIASLDLHIGDMVYVEKGGEIIPKITGVDLASRPQNSEKVTFITHCPECGCKLVRYEDEAAHYCTNESTCPPQIKGRIEHFISRRAMNIEGLGHETVDQFYQEGMIRDAADLYTLQAADICRLDRMGEKSAENIIKGVEKSKQGLTSVCCLPSASVL